VQAQRLLTNRVDQDQESEKYDSCQLCGIKFAIKKCITQKFFKEMITTTTTTKEKCFSIVSVKGVVKEHFVHKIRNPVSSGKGELPFMGYIGMCGPKRVCFF